MRWIGRRFAGAAEDDSIQYFESCGDRADIRSFAAALGPEVRVNGVAPGLIETDMTEDMDSSLKAEMKEEAFLKRLGVPEDISEAVLFLAFWSREFYLGTDVFGRRGPGDDSLNSCYVFNNLSLTRPQTGTSLPLQAVLVSIVMHSLWGGNPVAVKFGLLVFPPMWSAFIRFVIGIVCIAAWAAFRGVPMWPKKGEWRLLMLLGVLFVIQMGTLNIGFNLTKGSIAAILISTNPLFAAFAAHFIIVGDRLSFRKAVGLIIAFGGVAIVLLGGFSLESLNPYWVGWRGSPFEFFSTGVAAGIHGQSPAGDFRCTCGAVADDAVVAGLRFCRRSIRDHSLGKLGFRPDRRVALPRGS